MGRRLLVGLALLALLTAAGAWAASQFGAFEFNDGADHEIDTYYYIATGGKFPTGTVPNGDNASGGTIRFLTDDPSWGNYAQQTWVKDDWFPENAGFAMTLLSEGSIVYDNNGIEDGTYGSFYDYSNSPSYFPGLYMGYSMPNNYDWIYASYFKLEEETTFDTVIGYLDDDGFTSGWSPTLPYFGYRVNIYSAYQDDPVNKPNSWMPGEDDFTGDVFTSDEAAGDFVLSDTGVDRVFPTTMNRPNQDIWRVVFKMSEPVTLPAGVYFFSHQAYVAQEVTIDIKPGAEPNSIDLKSKGRVPVALLTTDDFDAEDVNLDSIYLAGAAPFTWTFEDVDQDGDVDLLMYFLPSDLMLTPESTSARLRAFTLDGDPILGTDSVKIPSGSTKGGKKK